MTTQFLFSGADPTGREDLYAPARSASSQGPVRGLVARSVFALLVVANVFGASNAYALARRGTAAVEQAPMTLDGDPVLEAVLHVRSDGEPPTERSRKAAFEAVQVLRGSGLEPERVLADPDGGVALYVFGDEVIEGGSHARYARLASTNDGDLLGLCVDRVTPHRDVWDAGALGLQRSVERVRKFIRDGSPS